MEVGRRAPTIVLAETGGGGSRSRLYPPIPSKGVHASEKMDSLSLTLLNDSFHSCIQRLFADSHSLYLFCSGGRGHRSVKEALVEKELYPIYNQIREQFPQDVRCKDFSSFLSYSLAQKWVSELDILHDCLGYLGKLFSSVWNWALKNGHQKIVGCMVALQELFDYLYSLIIFLRILRVLQQRKISRVISTQPLALKATLWAIRVYNYWLKKSPPMRTHLSLYLTDFPSKGAGHFLRPLHHLSKGLTKSLLYLYIPCPNPSNTSIQTLLSCLPIEQITLLPPDRLPVRRAFCLPPPSTLDPEENAFFCMLGSTPHLPTLLGYLSLFQKTATRFKEKNWHLFLYKGETFSKLLEKQALLCPSNLRVSILGVQSPEQIASLFWRCHTITRAGGSTLMELLIIESQRQKTDLPLKWRDIHTEEAPYAIPPWEKENAHLFSQGIAEGQTRLVSPTNYSSVRFD